ncbi:MAG: ABC transporter permease [Cryobacterium sp.]|nr:ABC transporter permease [Cryobacterium sp.]
MVSETSVRIAAAQLVGNRSRYTTLSGFWMLVWFIVRRNWLRMLVWLVVLAGMIPLVIDSQRELFPTQAAREAYAQVANTPAVAAMTGLPYAAATLGGILNIKLWMTEAVALAFAVIFLVTRNGRAEEENGRTEFLRSTKLGRHAYSLANWAVFGAFSTVVGLACAALAISQGLPPDGSLLMGASFAAVALVFIGVVAIVGQLCQTSRAANGLASIVVAIAYLIRATADVKAKNDQPLWIAWLSPIGWGQQARSFAENLWWPILLCLGVAILLCIIALRLESHRDLGAGMLPARKGRKSFGAFGRTQLGLTLRLQRGPIIGWAIGILVFAAFFGGVATAMVDLLGGNTPVVGVFAGHSGNLLDGLLSYFVMTTAMIVAAFALQVASAIGTEESTGRIEIQLSGAISRIRWAANRLIVPAVISLILLALGGFVLGATFGSVTGIHGQDPKFAAYSTSFWPSVLLVIAVTMFLIAFIPRFASALTWAFYGVVVLLSLLGNLFKLPSWLVENTPFTTVSKLNANLNVAPLVVLSIIAIVLLTCGLLRFKMRDTKSA